MNVGLSDRIRALARAKYVSPALTAGKRQLTIRVRDLLGDLSAEGFPSSRTPQICSAIQTAKFLRENGLEIEAVDGPPKKVSSTVIVHYRVAESAAAGAENESAETPDSSGALEDPSARAMRLTAKLRGLLKEELAAYGGGEAFLRWVRSEDEDAA